VKFTSYTICMDNVSRHNGYDASSPETVTHAFTLNQSNVGWAMIYGLDTIVNRNLRMKPGWYGVSLGVISHIGVADDNNFRTLYPAVYPGFQSFANQRGCLIGLVYIAYNLPHSACASDMFACPNHKVKSIITKCINLDVAIPCVPLKGFWQIADDSLTQFRLAIKEHLDAGNKIHETHADKRFPQNKNWESANTIAYEEYPMLASKTKRTTTKEKFKTCHVTIKPVIKTIQRPRPVSTPNIEAKKSLVAATSALAEGAADIRQFFGKK